MITDPATYFRDGCGRCARFQTDDCAARVWSDAIALLRTLCLDAGLTESLRWAHPCYRHAGRNLALIGAVRDGPRLTLPDAALLDDAAGLLEPAGPNTQAKTVIRFRDAADVAARAKPVADLLAQARDHAAAGRIPPKTPAPALDLPPELMEALRNDPDLARAFDALTPGRQRSYGIALASAKTAATRRARIARLRDKIIAGKGATER